MTNVEGINVTIIDAMGKLNKFDPISDTEIEFKSRDGWVFNIAMKQNELVDVTLKDFVSVSDGFDNPQNLMDILNDILDNSGFRTIKYRHGRLPDNLVGRWEVKYAGDTLNELSASALELRRFVLTICEMI